MGAPSPCRNDLFVVGIGNPLREDDQVGLYLVERLRAHFGAELPAMVVYEPDIVLAETIAAYKTLLIVDASVSESEAPFRLAPLAPAATFCPGGGFSSHVFDWGMILAMARDLFGHAPQAFVCGVRARHFGISESLSPQCQADAEAAFVMLCEFVTERNEREGQEPDRKPGKRRMSVGEDFEKVRGRLDPLQLFAPDKPYV